jgi:hypothetical protein
MADLEAPVGEKGEKGELGFHFATFPKKEGLRGGKGVAGEAGTLEMGYASGTRDEEEDLEGAGEEAAAAGDVSEVDAGEGEEEEEELRKNGRLFSDRRPAAGGVASVGDVSEADRRLKSEDSRVFDADAKPVSLSRASTAAPATRTLACIAPWRSGCLAPGASSTSTSSSLAVAPSFSSE